MILRFVTVSLLLFLLADPLSALDQARLKNGDRLSGSIIEADEEQIIIQCIHGNYRLPMRLLQSRSFDGNYRRRVLLKNGSIFVGRIVSYDAANLQLQIDDRRIPLLWADIKAVRLLVE